MAARRPARRTGWNSAPGLTTVPGMSTVWSAASFAGLMAMVVACAAHLDGSVSAGALLAGGVALGALGELVVAVVHNRRLRPEAAAV